MGSKARAKKKGLSVKSFIGDVIEGLHNRSELLRDKYNINSIQIFDEHVETMDLNLSDEKKTKLIESGKRAMWEYVDTYLGTGIVYNHLPDYKDVREKYYIKGPVELNRILQEDIMPVIQELNSLIKLIGKNPHEKLAEIQEKLKQHSDQEIKKQIKLYERVEELSEQIELSHHSEDVQEYLTIKKDINSEIIELIHFQKLLEHLIKNNIIDKLRKTEAILHEHVDIILDALSGYRKDYPDPRASEDIEQFIYDEKEKFREAVVENYVAHYKLTRETANQKASEQVDLFADLVRFGIKIPEAKLLARNYASILTVMSQSKENGELLTYETEKIKNEAREGLFTGILIKTLKLQGLISSQPSNEQIAEIEKLFLDLVDEFLDSDQTITRGYAEYLAKERIVKWVEKRKSESKLQTGSVSSIEGPKDENFSFAVKLRETVSRLRKGKWDEIVLMNHADVQHNLSKMEVEEEESVGKHESTYSVKTLEMHYNKTEHYLSVKREYRVPPVKVFLLTPQKGTLQDPTKKVKEIILAFDQPFFKQSEREFAMISKHSETREEYFNQAKAQLLNQLKRAIQEAKKLGLNPPNAKFQITLSGEGLAGQDAQYMLNTLLDELIKDPLDNDLKDIRKIDLDLVDASRVSSELSQSCAKKMVEVQKKKKLSIQSYNIIHQHSFAGKPSSKRMQNYVGEENILSHVTADTALVKVDFRDKYDPSKQYKKVSNEGSSKPIEAALNKTKLIYFSPYFKIPYIHLKPIKRLGSRILFRGLPRVMKALLSFPFYTGRGLIRRLANPFIRIHQEINKKDCQSKSVNPGLKNYIYRQENWLKRSQKNQVWQFQRIKLRIL